MSLGSTSTDDLRGLLLRFAGEIAFGVAPIAKHIADSQREYLLVEHIEAAAVEIIWRITQLLVDAPESAKIEDVIHLLIDALRKDEA